MILLCGLANYLPSEICFIALTLHNVQVKLNMSWCDMSALCVWGCYVPWPTFPWPSERTCHACTYGRCAVCADVGTRHLQFFLLILLDTPQLVSLRRHARSSRSTEKISRRLAQPDYFFFLTGRSEMFLRLLFIIQQSFYNLNINLL